MAEHGRAPRGSPGWAPAVGRRIAKNAAANAAFLAEKTAKTMQNDLRSSFLAPFRADRATAVMDIVVRMTVDDLRRSSAAAARKMSVYVWSAFLAGTRFRAKIAPSVARFGRDPPSHHGVRARGLVAEIGAPEAAQCPARQLSQPGRSWGPPHRLRPALRRAG